MSCEYALRHEPTDVGISSMSCSPAAINLPTAPGVGASCGNMNSNRGAQHSVEIRLVLLKGKRAA